MFLSFSLFSSLFPHHNFSFSNFSNHLCFPQKWNNKYITTLIPQKFMFHFIFIFLCSFLSICSVCFLHFNNTCSLVSPLLQNSYFQSICFSRTKLVTQMSDTKPGVKNTFQHYLFGLLCFELSSCHDHFRFIIIHSCFHFCWLSLAYIILWFISSLKSGLQLCYLFLLSPQFLFWWLLSLFNKCYQSLSLASCILLKVAPKSKRLIIICWMNDQI